MPNRQPPHRPDKEPEPAVTVSPKCPSCGLAPAVVFEVVQTGDGQPVEPRQVCLVCCPKVPEGP